MYYGDDVGKLPGMPEDALVYAVLSVVEEIPSSKVASYGQIASLTGGIRTRLGRAYSEIFVTFRYWRAKPAFFRKAANLPEIRVPEVEEFSRDGFFVRQGKNAGNI